MRLVPSKQTLAKVLIGLIILLCVVSSVWTSYRVLTLQSGQKVAVGPLTVSKPDNKIVRGYVNDDGDLIFMYSDGSSKNVGHVAGSNGTSGSAIGPTDAQISAAVTTYCADGHCDGKAPTPEQVAYAVSTYCANGACVGAKGADGQSVTADMVMTAVSSYCANGACTGPAGATGAAGVNGTDGRTTVMSCVIRTTNNLTTQYVAWRYTDEANSAYRDLYKLPTWAQGSNCVDLRAA